MKTSDCVCGHEKRDHRAALGMMRYGACKVCLCDAYLKPAVIALPRSEIIPTSSQARDTCAASFPASAAGKVPTSDKSS